MERKYCLGVKPTPPCPCNPKPKNKYSGFRDKNGNKVFLGDKIRVYDRDTRIVKFGHAWHGTCDDEKVFGVTVDNMHKPLYRFGTKHKNKGIELLK